MSASVAPEILSEIDIFRELDKGAYSTLASLMDTKTFEAGDALFGTGESHLYMCAVLEGKVALLDIAKDPKQEHEIVTFGPGRVFGESLLFEDEVGAFALSAQATTPVTIARFSRDSVETLKTQHTRLYADLLQVVSRVLRRRVQNAARGARGVGSFQLSVNVRREHDLLGDRDVPQDALWGVQTLRAKENFFISGNRLEQYHELIEALAHIKKACAKVNHELGDLDEVRATAIMNACDEVLDGRWHGHFIVDMVQGGAGTSTNMNANEVLANRALQLLGRERGDYDFLHPNTHVNMSQSTNDVYPSALKIALLKMLTSFLTEVELLSDSFLQKGEEFKHVIKMGRTQLQDAVPMSLGQEFSAWGRTIREGGVRVAQSVEGLQTLNMGGTAIGTGINTNVRYAGMVVDTLSELTDMPLKRADDLVEETQDTSSFVELAGVLKMLAVRLSKICNDLRLLSSGPRCGFNEINLPPVQPGSSIMPGKVNPVIPEVVNQVAFLVIGLDTTVAMASEAGQLELNVFEPVIAFSLFSSIRMMRRAMQTLRLQCIEGITANEERCHDLVHRSIGIVTALNPHLGYEKTSLVAKEALNSGRPVFDVVVEKGFMSHEELEAVLNPESMLQPNKA